MVREMAERGPDVPAEQRVLDQEQTLQTLREESEVAHALLGLSGALADVKSVEETMDLAVRLVPALLGASRCFAATWDADSGRFAIHAHYGYDEEEAADRQNLSATPEGLPLLRRALEQRAPVVISDTSTEDPVVARRAAERGVSAYIGLPLQRWGEDLGGLGIEFAEPRDFTTKDQALARGIARQLATALASARRFNLLADLRTVGLRVGSKLRLAAVVEEVAAGAVQLLSAESAAVYFLDSTQSSLVAAGSYGRQPPRLAEAAARLDLTRDPWRALLAGEIVVVKDLAEHLGAGAAGTAAVAAPIQRAEPPMTGAVVLFFSWDPPAGADEAEALQVLAAQAATALENAQRFERQRSVARSLQEGLLATELPEMEGYESAAVYEPASGEADIGGDFFDVFDLGDGSFAIVVGDVSGKGAEAAAYTAMAKYMLRAFAIRNAQPASVLYHLNNALVTGFGEDRFATLMYALFDPDERKLTIAVGGHPPPLIYRAGADEVEAVGLSGTIVGAFADQSFDQTSFVLGPRDAMLAFTDGLVEARRGDELYGRERVIESLARHAPGASAEVLTQRVFGDAQSFGEINDDTVVFALVCIEDGHP
ncbi:MAG TPA: GAF domain-containing SpoIIE family protein phosphatase [Actinomycetota bacterium]|nr:GAF domain-containing SpoIIE family protein phosphatase [Actinomycetota bacterium]